MNRKVWTIPLSRTKFGPTLSFCDGHHCAGERWNYNWRAKAKRATKNHPLMKRESDPIGVEGLVSADELIVTLSDGRRLAVPLAWYPRLFHATEPEREKWHLLGDGYAIEWPDLDEHIGVKGILAGRASGESQQSLAKWLAARRDNA